MRQHWTTPNDRKPLPGSRGEADCAVDSAGELAGRLATRSMGVLTRAFTLIELLVVITIIGILASLLVGLAGTASVKAKQSRVQGELHAYMTAIEQYRATFNQYPPDNVSPATKTANPVINQLFYELTGTIYIPGRESFRGLVGDMNINSGVVKSYFNTDGFINASDDTNKVHRFLDLKAGQFRTLPGAAGLSAQVLTVPIDWPAGRSDNPVPGTTINPWRYVSTSPTNNPNGFDLWAEFLISGKLQVIGNWKQ